MSFKIKQPRSSDHSSQATVPQKTSRGPQFINIPITINKQGEQSIQAENLERIATDQEWKEEAFYWKTKALEHSYLIDEMRRLTQVLQQEERQPGKYRRSDDRIEKYHQTQLEEIAFLKDKLSMLQLEKERQVRQLQLQNSQLLEDVKKSDYFEVEAQISKRYLGEIQTLQQKYQEQISNLHQQIQELQNQQHQERMQPQQIVPYNLLIERQQARSTHNPNNHNNYIPSPIRQSKLEDTETWVAKYHKLEKQKQIELQLKEDHYQQLIQSYEISLQQLRQSYDTQLMNFKVLIDSKLSENEELRINNQNLMQQLNQQIIKQQQFALEAQLARQNHQQQGAPVVVNQDAHVQNNRYYQEIVQQLKQMQHLLQLKSLECEQLKQRLYPAHNPQEQFTPPTIQKHNYH